MLSNCRSTILLISLFLLACGNGTERGIDAATASPDASAGAPTPGAPAQPPSCTLTVPSPRKREAGSIGEVGGLGCDRDAKLDIKTCIDCRGVGSLGDWSDGGCFTQSNGPTRSLAATAAVGCFPAFRREYRLRVTRAVNGEATPETLSDSAEVPCA